MSLTVEGKRVKVKGFFFPPLFCNGFELLRGAESAIKLKTL